MMVEATPFQKANLIEVVTRYMSLLIPLSDVLGDIASMPRRSAIAEAQAAGAVLWEVKKTAARDSWKEIARTVHKLADILSPGVPKTLELQPLASA
jgi:chromosome partitioning protein